MSNKKIGIMTMHKVLNYGSALQAYATQKFIEKSGYECELTDFLYPVAKKKKSIKESRGEIQEEKWEDGRQEQNLRMKVKT